MATVSLIEMQTEKQDQTRLVGMTTFFCARAPQREQKQNKKTEERYLWCL